MGGVYDVGEMDKWRRVVREGVVDYM